VKKSLENTILLAEWSKLSIFKLSSMVSSNRRDTKAFFVLNSFREYSPWKTHAYEQESIPKYILNSHQLWQNHTFFLLDSMFWLIQIDPCATIVTVWKWKQHLYVRQMASVILRRGGWIKITRIIPQFKISLSLFRLTMHP